MGISKKLMIFFMIIILTTFTIVFSFTYLTTQYVIEDKFGYLLSDMVNRTTMHIDTKIEEVERSLNMLIMNSEFTSYYVNNDKLAINEYVKNMSMATELANITIYSSGDIKSIIVNLEDEQKPLVYGQDFSNMYDIKKDILQKHNFFFQDTESFFNSELINNIMKGPMQSYWCTGLGGNYDDFFLMKKLSHWDNGKTIGNITIIMDMDVITDLYSHIEEKFKSTNIIVDNKGEIVAHSDKNFIGTKVQGQLLNVLKKSDEGQYYNIDGQLIAYQYCENGWIYISSVPMNSLTNEISNSWKTSLFIIALSILIASLVFFIYTRRLSINIRILINKMIKVEEGSMIIEEKINTNDEIGILDTYFNRMIEKLNKLIKKNYIQELEKRQAELSALQFQINPHFLYNTLESISAIGTVYGSWEICQVSQKLGEMFRYSIDVDSSDFVALDKEITHLDCYFFIQQIRFEDRFKVYYDIDPQTKESKVLKLILQPIVENIIQHGFEEEEEGIIQIKVFKEEGLLVIEIADDGKGMSVEQVKKINIYINEDTDKVLTGYKKSIGMRNVNLRIKLAYGKEYGINVISKEGIGTTVKFKLPLV